MSSLFKPTLEKIQKLEARNHLKHIVELGFKFNPIQPSHQTLQSFYSLHHSKYKTRNPSLKIYYDKTTIQPWSSPHIHIQMANRDFIKMECEGLDGDEIKQTLEELDTEYTGQIGD